MAASQKAAMVVLEQVDLTEIRLVGSMCRAGNVNSERPPEALSQSLQTYFRQSPQDKSLDALLRFELSANPEGGDSQKDSLGINAMFELSYSTQGKEFSEQQLDAFGSTVAAFVAWPYWREFTQSMTVRMGLPALTLPMLQQGQLVNDSPPKRKKSARKKKP